MEAYDQAISLDNFFIEAYVGRGNVHMDYLTSGRLVMSKYVTKPVNVVMSVLYL